MFGLETGLLIILGLCLLCACIFEFVNGFHDTANAVATVIYTRSLKPQVAVAWSGFWNFLGVFDVLGIFGGGIGVAMGIVKLLPISSLMHEPLGVGLSMVLAMLISAILWNLGTWYFGIPASSSHTLIGSIIGVGIMYQMMGSNAPVNWAKAQDVGLSLLISPLFGFAMAALIFYLMKWLVKNPDLFKEEMGSNPPPLWIRAILVFTCTGVSYAHGSNDGQKGVGLIMLILILMLPTYFALDASKDAMALKPKVEMMAKSLDQINVASLGKEEAAKVGKAKKEVAKLQEIFSKVKSNLPVKENLHVRNAIADIDKNIGKLLDKHQLHLSADADKSIKGQLKDMKKYTDYAPFWVILAISLSLGLGTMVGWKRIVTTIGEKIGKQHLTYAQGASAEMVAMTTIGVASWLELPVSTTHVLSSGVAGTMAASGGMGNLEPKTLKSILSAWVLTLPVTMVLSGALFWIFRLFA
jgi:PiT family inorganic phosphate transporter